MAKPHILRWLTAILSTVLLTYQTALGDYYLFAESRMLGDVNNDGTINATDASLVLVYASLIGTSNNVSSYDSDTLYAMDYNEDKNIDATDASLILEYAAYTATESSGMNTAELLSLTWSGISYVVINDNIPYFTSTDKASTTAFESYSELDSLGRCGVAYACVGIETIPSDTDTRSSLSGITPSGWIQATYDTSIVPGGYLYNRCHLIAYDLGAENRNEQNLITGTKYFNTSGMYIFENDVTAYIDETENHVLYRVTPIFDGDNLVANGVLMEAYSLEDNGEGIEFCVYVFNVQPGITIDYATGKSWLTEEGTTTSDNDSDTTVSYVLNTSTKKFHYSTCYVLDRTNDSNKENYQGTREELISLGYSPCGICNP